jgi:glycosyltransferase involved in cell wall biosynthesis
LRTNNSVDKFLYLEADIMCKIMPKVSIGLPVYNGENYLEHTLDAILAQTYQDFELIIADNASIDKTQEICKKYLVKDKRIKYFRNPTNIGAAPNHNLVFHLAKGEYFKWVGHDDDLSPSFISKCVEILDYYPDVVLCMPKTSIINKNGEIIGDYEYNVDASSQAVTKRFASFVRNLETGNHVYGLIRSETIVNTSLHGSYPSSDLVFLAELSLYGRYYIIPERLFFRRYHEEQSTKGKLSVERNRVAWFDTSLKTKIVLPKWLYLFGYINAIRRAPIRSSERFYCYLVMLPWIFYPPHFRALGKDILIAILNVIGRGIMMLNVSHKRVEK